MNTRTSVSTSQSPSSKWRSRAHQLASMRGSVFAAYLGLTPREHSSAHSRRLGSITKRGNVRAHDPHPRSSLCAASWQGLQGA
jgi:hypothetical protein